MEPSEAAAALRKQAAMAGRWIGSYGDPERYKRHADALNMGAESIEILEWILRNCSVVDLSTVDEYESLDALRQAKKASAR